MNHTENLIEAATEALDIKLNAFYQYLCGILDLYQGCIPVLKDKFDAIDHDDLDMLNKAIQFQQAFLLKIRGFDASLTDYLTALDLPSSTLSAVIPLLREGDQSRFYSLLGEFEHALKEAKFYNEKCQVLLQTKIYTIDRLLAKKEFRPESTSYSPNAKEVPTRTRSFETTI